MLVKFLISYWYYIVIGILLVTIFVGSNKYKREISELELAHLTYVNAQLKADLEAEQKRSEVQQKIYEAYQKHIEDLTNALKDINIQYTINQSELNRLHTITNNNKSDLRSATKESLVDYTATLSNLFEECTVMVTDLAAKADEATVTAIEYHGIIEDTRKALQETTDEVVKESEEQSNKVEVIEVIPSE